jgi:hypothetical protein
MERLVLSLDHMGQDNWENCYSSSICEVSPFMGLDNHGGKSCLAWFFVGSHRSHIATHSHSDPPIGCGMQPDGHSIDEELSDAAAVGGTKEVGVMVAELPAGLPVAVAELRHKVATGVAASSSKSDICKQL